MNLHHIYICEFPLSLSQSLALWRENFPFFFSLHIEENSTLLLWGVENVKWWLAEAAKKEENSAFVSFIAKLLDRSECARFSLTLLSLIGCCVCLCGDDYFALIKSTSCEKKGWQWLNLLSLGMCSAVVGGYESRCSHPMRIIKTIRDYFLVVWLHKARNVKLSQGSRNNENFLPTTSQEESEVPFNAHVIYMSDNK